MIDNLSEVEGNQQIQEKEIKKPLYFKQEVVVNELPFIFEGDIPQDPNDFEWSVSVPNWEKQKPKFEEMMAKEEITPHFDRWLEKQHLGNGRAGVLEIKKISPPDKASAVGLEMIHAATYYLPKEYGYHNAEDVGSFLLDNLCALADIKRWRIHLEPVERSDSKLSQEELYDWYRRRGFEDNYKFPKETHWYGGIQRRPGKPDESQVIVNLLRSKTPVK